MAYAGKTINNPVTGEHITFLNSSRDTRGEYLLFECRVAPDGTALPPHVHASQDERIEVIAGTLGVLLESRTLTLGPGETVCLPAGMMHQWWNAGRDELRMRVGVVPPRNFEAALEVMSAMARDGKMGRNGLPTNIFQLANLLALSETYLPGAPIGMQRVTLGMIASVGRRFGYDAAFAAYRRQTRGEMETAANQTGAPSRAA